MASKSKEIPNTSKELNSKLDVNGPRRSKRGKSTNTSGKDADTTEHKPTDDHSVDTTPDQVNVDEIQNIPIQKSNEDHCINNAYQVTDNADVLNNPNQEKFLDISCVPHCKHHDKFHVSPTVKCCLCMKMMHMDCCNVSENEAQGYWTCLQCRSLPQLVLSIQQQVSTILKLLSEMDSKQPYNKLQQSICDISANLSPVEGLRTFSENQVYRNHLTNEYRHPASRPVIDENTFENVSKSSKHQQVGKHCITIAHINVATLLPKISEIRHIIHEQNINVLSVQESRLNHSVFDKEIEIDGFILFRNDRKRTGGGVAIYVQSKLLPELCPNNYNS